MKRQKTYRWFNIGVVVFLMNCNLAMHAMNYAKNAFSGMCTGLHWGIAAAPFWAEGVGILRATDEDIVDTIDAVSYEAPQEVQQFVQAQLDQAELARPIQIRYSKGISDKPNYFAIGSHALGVCPTYDKQEQELTLVGSKLALAVENRSPLECLLEERRKATSVCETNRIETELDKHRFAIMHEAVHLKHNDARAAGWVSLTGPFITQGAGIIAKRALPMLSTRFFLVQNLLKIPSGYVKNLCTQQLILFSSRYQERRADVSITDPKLIQGGIAYFKEQECQEKEDEEALLQLLQEQLDTIEAKSWMERQIKKFVASETFKRTLLQSIHINDDHPRYKERIAYLEKHLEQLSQNKE